MKAFFAIAILFGLLISYGCVSQNGEPPVIVGNDSDSHGCKGSAGYSWCEVLNKCLRSWEEDCTAPIVGNDSDSHGCKASAGYSWCEVKQKCLRSWEENCTAVACTEEAKICPDGSAVGRQGPNCEFAPCPTNYTLYGKISIGPLCPVEPCGREFDYSSVSVNVYDSGDRSLVARVNADALGSYGVKLGVGNYLVNVTDASGNSFGFPQVDYTQPVTIEEKQKISMDFEIDTGIR